MGCRGGPDTDRGGVCAVGGYSLDSPLARVCAVVVTQGAHTPDTILSHGL
jgi:hypothetical protein